MGQNELITGWVYKKGELVRQRFNRMRLLKIFSGLRFSIYKKIFGIKDEEIIFTNYKISSTNKTWILNDESNTLTSVKLDNNVKRPGLVFKITTVNQGKPERHHKIHIPVPGEEMTNAKKIYNYFNGTAPA